LRICAPVPGSVFLSHRYAPGDWVPTPHLSHTLTVRPFLEFWSVISVAILRLWPLTFLTLTVWSFSNSDYYCCIAPLPLTFFTSYSLVLSPILITIAVLQICPWPFLTLAVRSLFPIYVQYCYDALSPIFSCNEPPISSMSTFYS
jgi:hypothetical protein